MPVDGHPLPLFPALNCRDIAVEVPRDFLPRIQSAFRRWCARGPFSHLLLRQISGVNASLVPIVTYVDRGRQSTAFNGKPVQKGHFCELPLATAGLCARYYCRSSGLLQKPNFHCKKDSRRTRHEENIESHTSRNDYMRNRSHHLVRSFRKTSGQRVECGRGRREPGPRKP